MRPVEALRELVFPLTDLTVALAIVGFGLLLWLASFAGVAGIWLLVVVVPALARYAGYLCEARLQGSSIAAADIGLFSLVDSLRSLAPLILAAAAGLAVWLYRDEWPLAAAGLAIGFVLVFPASIAVLALTGSPLASINPVAIGRLVRACGAAYFYVPVGVLFAALIVRLATAALPGIVTSFAEVYLVLLTYSLTGAVVGTSGVAGEVDIEAPVEPSPESVAAGQDAVRRRIADHAYGLVSRGNREGGLGHIRKWVATDPDIDADLMWFFNELMRWEDKQAALHFGQECLAHFLHHDLEPQALKVMSRCVYEAPGWKPLPADREAAAALAKQRGLDDLAASMLA